MRILVIEDDKVISKNIQDYLKKEGFAVDVSFDGEDGEFLGTEETYDVIVLDINLPIKNGFDVTNNIRKSGVKTPILMLTAYSDIEDRVKGLNIGADDYLSKPFSMNELLARINALIRRSFSDPKPIIIIGNLKINPLAHKVFKNGKEIDLPAKEFAILEYLARNKEVVVTRTMILNHVWGSDFETFSNVVDVYVKNIRQKIDQKRKKTLIRTIRGKGYILEEENHE